MRDVILITILAILTPFIFCDSTNSKENNDSTNKNLISSDSSLALMKDSLKNAEKIFLENYLFKYSEYIDNCKDYERIISEKYKNDTLILRIGSIQNCIGKFKLDLKSSKDTLNLDIHIKEEIIKRKNGKIDTILTENDCDCYYYFDIGIKNVKNEFKTILINGHKFGRKQKGTGNENIIKNNE